MTREGRILIADDDATFLYSTADLLRREGYTVETAPDAHTAIEAVRAAPCDLLISDLAMPGNEGLALVRQVEREHGGLPIIILTGAPTTESAIASIELPVTAYLIKPVEFGQLLQRVDAAVARFRSYRSMRQTEQRLEQASDDFRQMSLATAPVNSTGAPAVDAFLALTLRNVMGQLNDLQLLGRALSGQQVEAHPCQLMNCPRGAQLQAAVKETIDVLEETKGAFKSKTLAMLRQRLELLLAHG